MLVLDCLQDLNRGTRVNALCLAAHERTNSKRRFGIGVQDRTSCFIHVNPRYTEKRSIWWSPQCAEMSNGKF